MREQEDGVKEMSDEEMDDTLERLLSVRQERRKKRTRFWDVR